MKPKAQVEYRAIADIKELPGNPRTIKKDQFEKLKTSIKDNADYFEARPIILSDRTGELVILAGNQRYKAAKAIGLKEVPTILLPNLSEEREKEIIIRDNVENGDWDWDTLANEWDAATLADWGVQMPDWASEAEAEIIEDEVPEPPAEPKTKFGEIYQLGNHRLMVGDSTKANQVAELMNGKKADMVFTDPPYGMNLNADFSDMISRLNTDFANREMKGGKYADVIGDHDDFTPELISTIFDNFAKTKEIIIWGADYFAELIPNRNDGSWFVWDKRQNDGDDIEAVKRLDKGYGSCFELCWSKNRHKRELVRIKWSGLFGMEKDDTKNRVHPTQKPAILAKWFIEKYSQEGGIIADIYGGSGSTMIACEQLNRICYMMELDPHYADVIIERWEKFTGQKAVRIKEAA